MRAERECGGGAFGGGQSSAVSDESLACRVMNDSIAQPEPAVKTSCVPFFFLEAACMQPDEFGNFIGLLVVQTAERELKGIQKLVRRDRKATQVNLPLAMAWVCQAKLDQLFDSNGAREAIRMMLAIVMQYCMDITGWDYSTMSPVMANRLDGYDAASVDEGQPVFNITKYFLACCEAPRKDVAYDAIIPDPEALQSLGDMVDAVALAELKRLKRDERCPTDSLHATNQPRHGG